ncbi:pilin [Thermodesulfobacteriota bacterium]
MAPYIIWTVICGVIIYSLIRKSKDLWVAATMFYVIGMFGIHGFIGYKQEIQYIAEAVKACETLQEVVGQKLKKNSLSNEELRELTKAQARLEAFGTVEVEADGVIKVVLNENYEDLNGKMIMFLPRSEKDGYLWQCKSPDIKKTRLPAHCEGVE